MNQCPVEADKKALSLNQQRWIKKKLQSLQLLGSCEAAAFPPHHRHPACINLRHRHWLKEKVLDTRWRATKHLQESGGHPADKGKGRENLIKVDFNRNLPKLAVY